MITFIKKLFQPIDLTKGKIWKVILLFALPILITTLLDNSFSLINTLILKETVGSTSVGAISGSGTIINVLFNFAFGCSSGFAVVISNKFGEKNYDDLKKTYTNSLILSIVLGVFITLLGLILLPVLLDLINLKEIYIEKATNYLIIIMIASTFRFSLNLFYGTLRAIGDSLFPLLNSLLTTILNIIFAYLFTGVIKWDTFGIGLATLLSTLIGCIIVFIYIQKKYDFLRLKKDSLKIDFNTIGHLLMVGLPLGFQWSVLFVGSFIQSSQVNQFGEGLATKAVTSYSHVEMYLNIPFSVLSSSMLSFAGQNYGAKDEERIKKGINFSLILILIFYFIILIAGFIITPFAPSIFIDAEEMKLNGDRITFYSSTYLYTVIPFFICQGVLQTCRAILQGIKKTIVPFLSGVGELAARAFVCYTIPYMIDPSNLLSDNAYRGICYSTPLAWIASVLIMGGSVIYFIYIKKIKFED